MGAMGALDVCKYHRFYQREERLREKTRCGEAAPVIHVVETHERSH
jgi:hypothetical protein